MPRTTTRGKRLHRQLEEEQRKEDKEKYDDDDDFDDDETQVAPASEIETPRQQTQELQVLVALFDSTGGPNWEENDGWLSSGIIPCDWPGVGCNSDNHVTALEFPNNNLVGTLPASMLWEQLRHLERVDVSLNPQLIVDFNTRVGLSWENSNESATTTPTILSQNATIPRVIRDPEQEETDPSSSPNAPINYLNVSSTATNSLGGLPRIANTLQIFDISRCYFLQSVREIRRLEQLNTLSMNHLPLNASAHDGFFADENGGPSLTKLQYLYASNASLTGTIPTALRGMSALQVLDWSYNSWQGSLSTQLAELGNLQELYLQREQPITEMSPKNTRATTTAALVGPLPEFATHPFLRILDLSHQQLSGSIATQFLAGIENTTLPLKVNLQNNYLVGFVPASLSRFTSLHLDLVDNYISGLALQDDDEECAEVLGGWMDGNVTEFGCDAILCPPGRYNEFGRQVSSDTKCEECNVLGSAMFYGSTSCRLATVVASAFEQPQRAAEGEELEPMSQYDILVAFYQATGGPDWINSDGWLEERNECRWYGVECGGGDVQTLTLPSNNMRGGTPSSLFQLPSLRRVVFSNNPNLEVDFYGLPETDELEDLLLSNTATYSLLGISNATNLQDLEIYGTQISGPNLGELYSLTTLKTLNMGNNVLDQSIPEAIGALSQLVSLRASNAGLYGTLPSNLASLTDLVILDLSRNMIVTPLNEQALNQLQQVRILNLQAQVLPLGGPLPALDGMISLLALDLSSNSITGSIPSNFLNGIKDKLRSLDVNLKNNTLTGAIPLEMALFREMNLDVTENRIEDIPEVLCFKEGWMDGLVSDYGCDAILCPPGTFNEEGRMMSDDGPCELCPSATLPHFGSAACPPKESSRPQANLSERDILELLFESTAGPTSWIRKDNWLDDESDICSWFGVGCDAESRVQSLVLSENGLIQSTPVELFQLGRLERLFLDNNPDLNVNLSGIGLKTRRRSLKGQPRRLQGSSLRSLIISKTATSSVTGISKASSLQILDLNATKITGDDLDELMTLTGLESLNIGHSRIKRSIPEAIGGLVRLMEFAAPNSGITGVLPQSLGKLAEIAVLDLSFNKLIGTLPASLGALTDIRILDLHDQSLSSGGGIGGNIPPFDNFRSLEKIDVSENRLSGEIPLTFLSGVFDKAAALEVILRRNSLRGGLPEALSMFAELNVDVTDNFITDLPKSLCSQELWMDGNAENFGCDAILCPPSTFNSNGRQVSAAEPCQPCSFDPKPYYGASQCLDNINTDAADGDTMVCPDGSVCYNHGVCLESAVRPGTFVCDCTVTGAYGIPFAGIACEYKATDICHTSGMLGTNNITSFCTNNGQCTERVEPGGEHKGCDCNDDLWKGDYCEERIDMSELTTLYPMKPTVDITQICPDDHICENGSQCIPSAQDGRTFECDCTDIDDNQLPVAGENCQYPATSLCNLSPPYSSFCVNGGACMALVPGGSEHMDCLCPEGLYGAHCEMTELAAPGSSESQSASIIAISGDGDGMESWQMALVFVLPALAILIVVAMIIAAYSNARKKNLNYVNVEALADSEYEKYATEDLESPKRAPPIRETESSGCDTPPSIVDRALATVPDEEHHGTGFFSLPDISKEFESHEDEEMAPEARSDSEPAVASRSPVEVEAGESPTTATSDSSKSSEAEDILAETAEMSGAAAGEATAVAAAIAVAANAQDEESEEEEVDEREVLLSGAELSMDELSTIDEGECSQTEASDMALSPQKKNAREREQEESPAVPETISGTLPNGESKLHDSVAENGTDNFRDAWSEKPRVAFSPLPPSGSFDSDDSNGIPFIGDIDDSPSGDPIDVDASGATGKSLFAGTARSFNSGEDSASFLDQSIGMSEDCDSERSASPFEQRNIQVSVEPSLAATMFGGRGGEISESSSADLSLNF